MTRSLRPRSKVDYSLTATTAQTPGWLKNSKDAANPPLQADTEDAKENRKPGQQASKKRRAADKGTDSGVLKSAHKDLKQKRGFSRAGKGGEQREPLQESSLEHQIQEKTSPANEDETVQHSVKATDRTEDVKASKQEAQIKQGEGKKGTRQKQKAGKAKARSPKESIEQDDEKDAKHVSEPDSTMPTQTRSRKRAATEVETASDSDAATAKQGAKGRRKGKKSRKEDATDVDIDHPSEDPNLSEAQPAGEVKNAGKGSNPTLAEPQQSPEPDSTAADDVRKQGNGTAMPGEDTDERVTHDPNGKLSTMHLHEKQKPGSAPDIAKSTFLELQAEYTSLQQKYEEIKAGHITDVETVITEVRAQEQAHTKKALQLAAHWEAEAQRQAAIAQAGDVTHLQHRIEVFEQELSHLQSALIDQEAQVLEKDEEIAELQKRLTVLIRLVETYQDTLPSPLAHGVEIDSGPLASPASLETGRSTKIQQLRSVLREARVSTGQLAHTPALHLKASQPGSVLASIRPQQSSRGMTERVPVSTRLVTEAASLRTVGVTPRTSLGAIVPYSVHTQAARSEAPQKHTTGRTAVQNGPIGLGLDYRTAAATPIEPQPDSRDPIDVEKHVIQQPTGDAGQVGASPRTEQGAQQMGLLSVYQSTQAGAWRTPADKDIQANVRQLAFTDMLQPSGGAPGSPGLREAAAFGEEQTVHGPEFQKMMQDGADNTPTLQMPQPQGTPAYQVEPVQNGNVTMSEAVPPAAVDEHNHTSKAETSSLAAISDITNKGLMNLVGLTINARQQQGGFSYSHPPTGFIFEIRQDESDSESEKEEACLIFNPLEFGTAAELLPPYLKYEIKFAPEMRLKLVSRIMSHLGQNAALES